MNTQPRRLGYAASVVAGVLVGLLIHIIIPVGGLGRGLTALELFRGTATTEIVDDWTALDPMELDLAFKSPGDFEDLETNERVSVNPRQLRKSYNELFGQFIDQYRQACAGMKIDHRIVRTDQPYDTFIRAYMTERQRLSK
jgi:hypothetical protein